MSFDSLTYLLFLPAVTLLHWLCPPRLRWALLLAASLVFYASWNLPLTLLLLAVIGISYLAGLRLGRETRPQVRRLILAASLTLCLALLAYFKYFRFLAEGIAALVGLFGHEFKWRFWDVLLPIGISFYSFQAMSYVIDVYREPRRAERHFGYFALYLSFFPQLVAGPIERAERLLPQLRAERRFSRDDLAAGLRLLASGYFRKLVIADFCGRMVTAVYGAESPDGSAVFAATLLFSLQIYNDFAGYSEIAQGSARLLGIRLMRNFDRPYLAGSFRDFWRRWHISLTQWFRDYVYIPLGGSRRGLARQAAVTLLVFALSGLWHGADWSFLVWGLFHGAFLVLETLCLRRFTKSEKRGVRAVTVPLTFLTVSFGWIFFRADSLSHAAFLIARLFSRWDLSLTLGCLQAEAMDALWLLLALLQGRLLERLTREEHGEVHDLTWVYLIAVIALSWLVRLQQSGANAFIYFQF